jgi:hypothetical protein
MSDGLRAMRSSALVQRTNGMIRAAQAAVNGHTHLSK